VSSAFFCPNAAHEKQNKLSAMKYFIFLKYE
jgi:hypothetical protein